MTLKAACLLALAATLSAAGCTSPPKTTYDWGGYEDSLYRMYVKRDAFSASEEANRLNNQLEQTKLARLAVPPGVEAHLGMLCAGAGDPAGAAAHFEAEKAAFPESAVFMDGLLKRLTK